MTDFDFDDAKDFEANLELFLQTMEEKSPDLGAILRANVASLKGADAKEAVRAVFNPAVKAKLDAGEPEPGDE